MFVISRNLSIFLVALALILTSACEPKADVETPRQYAQESVAFSYPGNWTVEEERSDGLRSIQIESPGSALVMLLVFEPAADIELDSFRSEVASARVRDLEAMFQVGEVKVADVSASDVRPITTRFGTEKIDGLVEKFSLSLVGEKVPHYSEFHRLDGTERNVIVVSQAAVEDWKKVRPGFQLIYDTLDIGQPR